MHTVYILRGKNNHLYTGCTSNLKRRIKRHISGHGAAFVKRNKVYKVVYVEKLDTLKEARHREKQIKCWRREKKENLIKYGKPTRE